MDADEIVFAIAIAKCVLIASCGFGAILYLAWAGAKRMFSDDDRSTFHFKRKVRLQPLRAPAQHALRSGMAIFQQHIRRRDRQGFEGDATHTAAQGGEGRSPSNGNPARLNRTPAEV